MTLVKFDPMTSRKKPTQDVQTEVLVASRRRCCICFGLHGDLSVKHGQLAHVDRNPANSDADNLAFMCLEHHDLFDTRPSQSKGLTPLEARLYRQQLYDELRQRDEQEGPELAADVVPVDSSAGRFEAVLVDDERLTLLWKVRQEPGEWLERDVEQMTPIQLMEILDGPFHAAPNCHERMAELSTAARSLGPQLLELCPGCKSLVFRRAYANLERVYVDGWRVRAQAIAELQRLHRLGRKIEVPRIVLERPQYWNLMLPPHPRPQG